MSAQLEVVKGDMFEGSSDLVVIPCSRVPTITRAVEDRLQFFKIPRPQTRMEMGDVVFEDLGHASSIAQVAAYAASAARAGVNAEAVERIGRTLGSYCSEKPWIGQIACPLLGTGAGGLEATAAASSLARGYLATAPERSRLRLFALDDFTFERIRSIFTLQSGAGNSNEIQNLVEAQRPIRVFISYTKSTDQHRDWVKGVASYLRSAGVDARLDLWHLRPGMDVVQWMCNELDMADRVLLICDELYAQKADGRHGGVGWEIRIIQGDLLQSQSSNPDKFVPVVVTADPVDGMPSFVKTVYCFLWPPSRRNDPSLREELVQTIYRAQEEAPPLGLRPSYVMQKG
jgi:TIR domain